MSKNITIIGASAGSGKTYKLSECYHACIAPEDGPLQPGVTQAAPDQVLTTTFTKKAAAELVQRLREKLLEKGQSMAALMVEDGYIGTVHSVCLRLLTDHALEAGLSPDISPLPEEDEDTIFSRATAGVLAKHGHELSRLEKKLGLDAYSPFGQPGLERWKDTVRNVVKMARANGMDSRAIRAQADLNVESLEQILPEPIAPGDRKKALRLAKSVLSRLKEMPKLTKKAGDALTALQGWVSRPDENWSIWQDLSGQDVGKRNPACEQFSKLSAFAAKYVCIPEFQDEMKTYVRGVFDCAADALDQYSNWKNAYGFLDYNDMEALAYKFITRPDIARILKGRIVQIFVDEFQDTSPLQLALFLGLADIARSSVWVGDPKQAIYGFRGTDPALMQAALSKIDGSRNNLLATSWRSRPCLVDFTNEFFSCAFSEYGMPAKAVVLKNVHRKELPGRPTGLRTWSVAESDDLQEQIARYVAWSLSGAQESGRQIEDRETQELRPLRAGDIAVLCRSNARCQKVAQRLAEYGIPVQLPLEGLMLQPEVRLCLAAYRYCVDAGDTLAQLELLRIVQPDAQWLDAILQPEKAALRQAFEETDCCPGLKALHKDLSLLSPNEALHKVAATLDMFRRITAWGQSEQRLGNIDMLYSLAGQYEESCAIRHESCTHAGFVHLLMDSDGEQAFGLGGEAVQVMTYHKAKGLEWPVVILDDLDATPRSSAFGLAMLPPDKKNFDIKAPLKNRTMHFWPWPCGAKKKLPSLMEPLVEQHPLQAVFQSQAREEHLRLLYVGMTRARDLLVLPFKEEDGGDAWLTTALPANADWKRASRKDPCFSVNGRQFPAQWEDLPAALQPLAGPGPETSRAPALPTGSQPEFAPLHLSPSLLGKNGQETFVPGEVLPLGGRLTWKGTLSADQTGSILHAWLCVSLPLLEKHRELTQRLKDFANLWEVAPEDALEMERMARRLHEGLPVLASRFHLGPVEKYLVEYPVFSREGESILSGRMDLLVECEKGLLLIDHKYVQIEETHKGYAAIVKEYNAQLQAYKLALQKKGYGQVHACLHLMAQGLLLPMA